ncbi:exopolysaccharide biosynthesis polyprenyl glycosylphosphotransferase [Williamsia limnetica]|uniref:Exopolysaccharide biosynthesis polyprenyl glycosylphosphotransferase n=1 Tax=Williamsia limnetica TaxID=882452 RepID=A0A318RTA8_WILLI|nr:sugar transferase [Williamsia limnetica]PYE20212.1 exopolysaccharide biosynthesis polyprenyl glycosylphosphotransferase [Williamsia limnetica]
MPPSTSSRLDAPVNRRFKSQVSDRKYFLTRRRTDVGLPILDFVIVIVGLLVISETMIVILLGPLIVVALVELSGNYRAKITLSALNDLPRLAAACFAATFTITALFEIDANVQRVLLLSMYVTVILFVVRLAYYSLRRRRRRKSLKARSRTVVVGGGVVAAELLESIAEYPELGMEPVAVVDGDPMYDADHLRVPVFSGRPLREIVESEDIHTVIVAFRNAPDSTLVSALRECDKLDCEIFLVPRLFEFVHLTSDMDRIHTVPLIRVRRHIYRTWFWNFKRLFDFTLSGLALVALSPILGVTALAVYLSDRTAPIIFSQVRVGRNGDEFTLFKFRSMRPVAPTTSDQDWRPDKDNRVNFVGKLIRKTSIDELPQLWNVVKGDMSLVGPRPERPHFVNQFKDSVPSYRDRHRVNVGLTGWAAIHGLRGDTSIDDRALYDNFYIENWSVWLDIKIIILTIRAVIRGTGS